MNNKRLLQVEEAAEYLGIKKQTLYNKISAKEIPYIKLFKSRAVRFKIEDLDRLIEEWRVETVNEWEIK